MSSLVSSPGGRSFARLGSVAKMPSGSTLDFLTAGAGSVPPASLAADCFLLSLTGLARMMGAGSFLSGFRRHSTNCLPTCAMGVQPSFSHTSASQPRRSSRTSLLALTLMSSWAFRLMSISRTTAGVKPLLPIMTTGDRSCACALSAWRWIEDNCVFICGL